MKIKCFIQHYLTKTTLAVLAAAVPMLFAETAHADTSWVRGGNWHSYGGGTNGPMFPAGLNSSMTTAQVATETDIVAYDDKSVGINFVRVGVDPYMVSHYWSLVQAYINELIADGLRVDICCWYQDTSLDGIIPNFNTWKSMWQKIDGVYKDNNMVYYEPINEPHGYSSADLRNNIYAPFLSFINKSRQDHIILDGTGYADNVADIGGDSRFTNCKLAVHDYPFWHTSYTTESAWKTQLASEVAGYQDRTIMTEFGAPTTTGLDYQISTNNNNISFLRGMCEQCRAWPMGSVYFPVHQATTKNNKRLFNGPGGGIINQSSANELQYGWDFFTTAPFWGICDFNVIGQTDYSLFRPSSDTWKIQSGGGTAWGIGGDIAVPADYLGTGQAQEAIWRPSNGDWYIKGGDVIHEGTNGDIPVPADYLGTGKAQEAVWRPHNGTWYILGGGHTTLGMTGDIPVPGYYLGDGHADMAVWRPSNGDWYINGGEIVHEGTNGDIPVPGDYLGIGTTQFAVWRPHNATLYIYGWGHLTYGTNGDIPVPGDYTRSGFTQFAVWRPSNNTWYVNGVGNTTWGTTGDVPLPLSYAIRHCCFGYTQ